MLPKIGCKPLSKTPCDNCKKTIPRKGCGLIFKLSECFTPQTTKILFPNLRLSGKVCGVCINPQNLNSKLPPQTVLVNQGALRHLTSTRALLLTTGSDLDDSDLEYETDDGTFDHLEHDDGDDSSNTKSRVTQTQNEENLPFNNNRPSGNSVLEAVNHIHPNAKTVPTTPSAGRKSNSFRSSHQYSYLQRPARFTSYIGRKPKGYFNARSHAGRMYHYMQNVEYKDAVKLISTLKGGKEAVLKTAADIVSFEIKSSRKSTWKFKDSLSSVDSLTPGSVDVLTKEAEATFPSAVQLIKAILTSTRPPLPKANNTSAATGEGSNSDIHQMLTQRMLQILSILLYTFSKTFQYPQLCVALELWRNNCPAEVFTLLERLGISTKLEKFKQSLKYLDNPTGQVETWKTDIEKGLNPSGTGQDNISAIDNLDKENVTANIPAENSGEREEKPLKGYAVGWGKVQLHNDDDPPEARKWTTCFAVKNRKEMLSPKNKEEIPANTMSPYSFLPSPEDYLKLKERMIFVVRRIIQDNVTCFKDVDIPNHMTHPHYQKMCEKSEVAHLGLMNVDSSRSQGIISVMKHLQDLLPLHKGEPLPSIAYGAKLSKAKQKTNRKQDFNSVTAKERLAGLVESASEFEREACLFQDVIDKLCCTSYKVKGTVSQIKTHFRYFTSFKDFREKYKLCFKQLQFCIEGYILLLACKLKNIKSLDETPIDFIAGKMSKDEQVRYLDDLSRKVVDTVWMPQDSDQVQQAIHAFSVHASDSSQHLYCICGKVTDQEMIRCANFKCPIQKYHRGCVDVLPEDEDEEWFCSEACEESPTSIYCYCKSSGTAEQSEEENLMVQCRALKNCKLHEWYHLKCLGTTLEELPDPWYCNDECCLQCGDDDQIYNYSKALIWQGLNIFVRRDAVREGDGPDIVRHWKFDLLYFWTENQKEHFQTACRFLAGVSGFHGKRIQEDLIWNRLVNIGGTPGGNMGLEGALDYLNSSFKQLLSNFQEKCTESDLCTLAQLSGSRSQALTEMFGSQDEVAKIRLMDGLYNRSKQFKKQLKSFVEEYEKESLLEYIPPRERKEVDHFFTRPVVREPLKLGQEICEVALKMDQQKSGLFHNDGDLSTDDLSESESLEIPAQIETPTRGRRRKGPGQKSASEFSPPVKKGKNSRRKKKSESQLAEEHLAGHLLELADEADSQEYVTFELVEEGMLNEEQIQELLARSRDQTVNCDSDPDWTPDS